MNLILGFVCGFALVTLSIIGYYLGALLTVARQIRAMLEDADRRMNTAAIPNRQETP